MRITAQLALSQMKVNEKRTIAGIFATALATSLITTVMCFATSANKMLTDFLGSDYGEYGAVQEDTRKRADACHQRYRSDHGSRISGRSG